MNTGYEYLLEFFPDYDYRRPHQPERVDYSRTDNITDQQQRAFSVWWAVEQCWRTGCVGLDVGCGPCHTPWCLNTDRFSADKHPIYGQFGDERACRPQMVVRGDVRLPFEDDSFNLVLANHVVEHLDGDVRAHLRDWIRVLKPGGVLAVVLPDQAYNDVMAMDKDHKHAWTAGQFLDQVLEFLYDVASLEEFNTFKNNFSFDAVLRKK